jgi:3-dehydroquinate synthase
MVAEARLAETMGLAESGISQQIASYLQNSGLPTRSVNLKPETIRAAMKADKKKAAGKLKFTLPKRIGEVVWGIEADEKLLMTVLESVTDVE